MRVLAFALVWLPLAGCSSCSSSPKSGAVGQATVDPLATRAPAPPPVAPIAVHELYRLDLAAAPACRTGAPCDVAIAITALGGRHLNAEFPTRFVPSGAGDLVVDGAKLTIQTPTRGVMSVRVTPASAGTHTLDGQLKLAVCTDTLCEPQVARIELPIHSS